MKNKKYHPLTEILYDSWHMKTGKDVMDVRIRMWMREKAQEFTGVCTKDFAENVLEIKDQKATFERYAKIIIEARGKGD